MRHVLGIGLCLALLIAGGCTADPSKATRVDAFDPHGHSDAPLTPKICEHIPENGVLIRFDEGDELTLKLSQVDSELVEKADDHTLRARRPFYIFLSKDGIQVSPDDKNFYKHRVRGSLILGLEISEQSKQNTITLSLETED